MLSSIAIILVALCGIVTGVTVAGAYFLKKLRDIQAEMVTGLSKWIDEMDEDDLDNLIETPETERMKEIREKIFGKDS